MSSGIKRMGLILGLIGLVVIAAWLFGYLSQKEPAQMQQSSYSEDEVGYEQDEEEYEYEDGDKYEGEYEHDEDMSDAEDDSEGRSDQGGNSQPRPLNPNPTEESLIAFFYSKNPGDWRVRTNAKGEIFRIIGGEIPGVARDLASVEAFVSELAPELGIPPEQLTTQIEQDSTRNLRIFDSVQVFKGNEVFDAFFRIIGNNKTNAGIIFNNTTQQIKEEEVVVPAPIGLAEAESILKSHYGDKLDFIKDRKGPLVYTGGSPHELAYQFKVRLKDDDHLTLVGAQSQRVVYHRSERMH